MHSYETRQKALSCAFEYFKRTIAAGKYDGEEYIKLILLFEDTLKVSTEDFKEFLYVLTEVCPVLCRYLGVFFNKFTKQEEWKIFESLLKLYH